VTNQAWSYTSLTAFETCPRRYYRTRVAKDVADPPGEEALWGQRVHKAIENHLRSGAPLSKLASPYQPIIEKVAAVPGTRAVEQRVAVDADLKPVEFFAPTAWCRGVFDVIVDGGESVAILDWKTGKWKPETDQLELFAALARQLYPQAQRFHTAFVWLKNKRVNKTTYTRSACDTIWTGFIRRALRLQNAVDNHEYPPKPSGLCRKWCPVSDCEFHGV
jgi:hypothetical protein